MEGYHIPKIAHISRSCSCCHYFRWPPVKNFFTWTGYGPLNLEAAENAAEGLSQKFLERYTLQTTRTMHYNKYQTYEGTKDGGDKSTLVLLVAPNKVESSL